MASWLSIGSSFSSVDTAAEKNSLGVAAAAADAEKRNDEKRVRKAHRSHKSHKHKHHKRSDDIGTPQDFKTPAVQLSNEFYTDTKGDRDFFLYETLYRKDVPKYEVYEKEIGLVSSSQLARRFHRRPRVAKAAPLLKFKFTRSAMMMDDDDDCHTSGDTLVGVNRYFDRSASTPKEGVQRFNVVHALQDRKMQAQLTKVIHTFIHPCTYLHTFIHIIYIHTHTYTLPDVLPYILG